MSSNATMDPPELEEAVDTPDVDQESDEGDGPAILISYNDGALEVVELAGTDDEDVDADDLIERFDAAVKKGQPFMKVGRRRIRMDLVRSFGPEDECDYPEVSVFGNMEERAEKLTKVAEHVVAMVGQSAQGVSYLVEQQAALQQAQAQLFEEEVEGEGDDESTSQATAPRVQKKVKKGAPSMRPLKVPGVPTPPGK